MLCWERTEDSPGVKKLPFLWGEIDVQTKCYRAVYHADGCGRRVAGCGKPSQRHLLHRRVCGALGFLLGLKFHPCGIYNLEGKKVIK